jgi:DNA-binding NarL/FixJ family response regulator
MVKMKEKHIFLLDGQQNFTEVFGEILEELCIKFSCFTDVGECFDRIHNNNCDLLSIDLQMADADAITLVRNVKRSFPWLAILTIADNGDIPTAVKAIKAGAADVIEIPLNRYYFLNKIESLFQQNKTEIDKPLTQKEMGVLRLIHEGKSNKKTAYLLRRSTRTIEVHRRNIMQKLGVDNKIGLIKQAALMGLLKIPNIHNKEILDENNQ